MFHNTAPFISDPRHRHLSHAVSTEHAQHESVPGKLESGCVKFYLGGIFEASRISVPGERKR